MTTERPSEAATVAYAENRSPRSSLATLPVEIKKEICNYVVTPWSLNMFPLSIAPLDLHVKLFPDLEACVSLNSIPGRNLALTCRSMYDIVLPLQKRAFDGRLYVGVAGVQTVRPTLHQYLAKVHSLYFLSHELDEVIRLPPPWNNYGPGTRFSSKFVELVPNLKYACCMDVSSAPKYLHNMPYPALPSEVDVMNDVPNARLEERAGWKLHPLLEMSRNSTNQDGIVVADYRMHRPRDVHGAFPRLIFHASVIEGFHVRYQQGQFEVVRRALNWSDRRFILWKEGMPVGTLETYEKGDHGYDSLSINALREFSWVIPSIWWWTSLDQVERYYYMDEAGAEEFRKELEEKRADESELWIQLHNPKYRG